MKGYSPPLSPQRGALLNLLLLVVASLHGSRQATSSHDGCKGNMHHLWQLPVCRWVDESVNSGHPCPHCPCSERDHLVLQECLKSSIKGDTRPWNWVGQGSARCQMSCLWQVTIHHHIRSGFRYKTAAMIVHPARIQQSQKANPVRIIYVSGVNHFERSPSRVRSPT